MQIFSTLFFSSSFLPILPALRFQFLLRLRLLRNFHYLYFFHFTDYDLRPASLVGVFGYLVIRVLGDCRTDCRVSISSRQFCQFLKMRCLLRLSLPQCRRSAILNKPLTAVDGPPPPPPSVASVQYIKDV